MKILQYNVHTTEGKVMAPLLADHRISAFTILPILEPGRNPYIYTRDGIVSCRVFRAVSVSVIGTDTDDNIKYMTRTRHDSIPTWQPEAEALI